MATLAITIPEDLKRNVEQFKIIDWSAVAREAIRQRVTELRILKAISAKSKLTEEEALEFSLKLGKKVNTGIHEKHVKKYGS
ncbi:hypothetical protein HYX13_00890 [Candidatus Woesearchaeota archaeon]|nr:hypothetical protein [Candidatus Woesearchaeota archaeon]